MLGVYTLSTKNIIKNIASIAGLKFDPKAFFHWIFVWEQV